MIHAATTDLVAAFLVDQGLATGLGDRGKIIPARPFINILWAPYFDMDGKQGKVMTRKQIRRGPFPVARSRDGHISFSSNPPWLSKDALVEVIPDFVADFERIGQGGNPIFKVRDGFNIARGQEVHITTPSTFLPGHVALVRFRNIEEAKEARPVQVARDEEAREVRTGEKVAQRSWFRSKRVRALRDAGATVGSYLNGRVRALEVPFKGETIRILDSSVFREELQRIGGRPFKIAGEEVM